MPGNIDSSMKLFFLIAPCIYAVNFLISILFALKYSDPIYKKNLTTWFLYLTLVFTQAGLSSQQDINVFLKMTIWSFVVFIFFQALSSVIRDIYGVKENVRLTYIYYVLGVIASGVIYFYKGNSEHLFFPLVFFTSWPIVKLVTLLKNFKSNSFTKNGYLLASIALAIHVIDFAYAYDKPELIFPGYLIALIISTAVSCFSFAALIERAIFEIEIKDLLHNTSRLSALGGMAAEIAHEINNPLSAIRSNNYNLRKKIINGEVDKDFLLNKIDVYDNMTNRLIKIMEGLKSSYRNAENDQFKSTSISQIVDDIKILCELKADKAGVDLEFDTSLSNFELECRQVQITQILQNLINNAIDALEKSPQKVIKIKSKFINDKFVEIYVSDSGPGIPNENREKIFNTLFTTKYDGKGTGMGLSISKRYSEEHNGYLKLAEEQLPTTFILGLPLLQPKEKKHTNKLKAI